MNALPASIPIRAECLPAEGATANLVNPQSRLQNSWLEVLCIQPPEGPEG